MRQEDFNIHPSRYPWPYQVGLFSEDFYEEERRWIDTDYNFMSEATREKYKQHGLTQAASWMFPATPSRQMFRPMARFMVWLTLYDDYHELCPVHELAGIRDHIMDVMAGASPRSSDIGLLRQVAACRDEFLPFVNDEWIERWIQSFYRYTTYGIMEETPYKLSRSFPSLTNLLLVREYSISMYTYGEPVEPSIGFIVPRQLAEHPAIQRLKMLACRIFAIQNDFASLVKELAIDTERLNIVRVIQHQYGTSVKEACREAMRIHDDYVKEFEDLRTHLPDFGPLNKEMENYVYHYALMISGLGAWYCHGSSSRYSTPGAFPEPEYAPTDRP